MKRMIVSLTITIAAMLFYAMPAAAEPQGSHSYGVYAFAPSLVAHSTSTQPAFFAEGSSTSDAQIVALNECVRAGKAHPADYRNDCRRLVWVHNGFVAVSYTLETNGAYGSGWGETRDRAVQEAGRICQKNNYGNKCLGVTSSAVTPYQNSNEPADGGGW